jgi:hypothetical protein
VGFQTVKKSKFLSASSQGFARNVGRLRLGRTELMAG